MPKIPVYDLNKQSVGELELSDDVFEAEVNEALLYDVVRSQLASKRKGSANTKTRAEVNGTKRKMYRQKGTGRARHGTARAPIFVGGGKAHGPKPRDYSWRPPRRMRIGALKSALSHKFKEGRLTVVDGLELGEIKTKKLAGVLDTLETQPSALLVDDQSNERLRLSARNLQGHLFLPPDGVNVYDLLRHEHLVVTKDAVRKLEARCAPKRDQAEAQASA